MKFRSGPATSLKNIGDAIPISLFTASALDAGATAGRAIRESVQRRDLAPDPAAWDFLAIALSVIAADGISHREDSPDGWTREIAIDIAVSDPDAWAPQLPDLNRALGFLTTDRWSLSVRDGGDALDVPLEPHRYDVDAVALLSGGLDSLIGAIDLTASGLRLLATSHVVRGDAEKQEQFARELGIERLPLNHNASTERSAKETSQRARSLIFLAYAVLAATCTDRYRDGGTVPIYMCENGFIAINPPLTTSRISSLSTRTARPEFLDAIERILRDVGLNVRIINPYLLKTKGEMMQECSDQTRLAELAHVSTSCGRFQRFNYTHCGRCVPCQIRRASFLSWGRDDSTRYYFHDIGKQDSEHAGFDDVRSVAIARYEIEESGFERWVGPTLSSLAFTEAAQVAAMLRRGMLELGALHDAFGVK
ncbi:Qat anti-phage system QueC-like protein QatC [Curtobacterium sp. MCBA15_016]|uniref:Qat anti-phage system QueC-like protein QatC n=1 Tax=Curtobacterium sp. MCBA15_016 TaxID=1898740 RepID=UPI0009F5FABA|nr:Qat anti-phage system QueC-like protein QatC [Curtobacterium sp. MCBA15_016]